MSHNFERIQNYVETLSNCLQEYSTDLKLKIRSKGGSSGTHNMLQVQGPGWIQSPAVKNKIGKIKPEIF